MHRFSPPPKPDDFDAKVKGAKDDAEAKISASYKFSNKWGDFKAEMSEAQKGKCGYCEIRVIGGQHGDVEHFRPKGAIWRLDPDNPGQERDFLSSVEGRKKVEFSDIGYWWLAYEWDNYLLSCQTCNQQWKISFFPVKGEDERLKPDTNEPADFKEFTLLLNPFHGPHPAKHLTFNPDGSVEPRRTPGRSPYGFATINTVGLDRPSLRTARLEKAQRAHRVVQELLKAIEEGDDDAVERALFDIREAGDERFDFCGVVRTVFEQGTLTSWDELETLTG